MKYKVITEENNLKGWSEEVLKRLIEVLGLSKSNTSITIAIVKNKFEGLQYLKHCDYFVFDDAPRATRFQDLMSQLYSIVDIERKIQKEKYDRAQN